MGQFCVQIESTKMISGFRYSPIGNGQYLGGPSLWGKAWANQRATVFCDNQAVVSVICTGKTRDPYLEACAQNIHMLTAIHNIDLRPVHVLEVNNSVADVLSRWQDTPENYELLYKYVPNPQWCSLNIEYLYVDFSL